MKNITRDNLALFRSPDEKARFVRHMFDRISPRYDLMNRIMTFGQDIRWRRLAVRMAQVPQGGRLLDVACGTGDLARTALRYKPSLVCAADFSLRMVELGARKHAGKSPLCFLAADGLALPFPGRLFDAAITGFSLRNVVDIDRFLSEMQRVVKPGGRVVILEITPFRQPLLAALMKFYFHKVVPILGTLIAGDREAYTYLPQSVEIFLTADELANRMRCAGLQEVHYRLLNMKTVAIHTGMVPETPTD